MKLKSYGARTDQGPYLNINEDNFEINFDKELFIVADGFGGAGIGDIATKNLLEEINNIYGEISGDPDATLPFFFNPSFSLEGNALVNAALKANQKLCSSNQNKEMKDRAGASATIVAQTANLIHVLGIGNTAMFLDSQGKIERVYQEDSFYFLNRKTRSYDGNTVPLSAFGLYDQIQYNYKEVKIAEGDSLVLLTDGVYSRLEPGEINSILHYNSRNTAKIIDEMFDLANERGNLDNQTALVLRY